jgi:hypothetical protein
MQSDTGRKAQRNQGFRPFFVTPADGEHWRLNCCLGGKRNTLSLAAYSALTLHETRKWRNRAKESLTPGIDPGIAHREEHAQKSHRQHGGIAMEQTGEAYHARSRAVAPIGHLD